MAACGRKCNGTTLQFGEDAIAAFFAQAVQLRGEEGFEVHVTFP